jgi:hypothetical protein
LPKITVSRIRGLLAMIEEVLRGHHSKGTRRRQDAHLRRAQVDGLIPVSNGASRRAPRQIERA